MVERTCRAGAGGAAGPLRQEERQGRLLGAPLGAAGGRGRHGRKPLSAQAGTMGVPWASLPSPRPVLPGETESRVAKAHGL